MIRITSLLGFLFAILWSNTIINGEDIKRTSVIEDNSGVITEVYELGFSGDLERFYNASGCIGIINDFQVAIPIKYLISVRNEGKTVKVVYQLGKQVFSISGPMERGSFTGKSDFGNFDLDWNKMRQLTFKGGPINRSDKETLSPIATLILTDNTRVPVSTLRRGETEWRNSYPPTPWSSYRVYCHYTNFKFLRGGSLVTSEFNILKSIEFEADNKVLVTMKSGVNTRGELTDNLGFTGEYERGFFFIECKHLKAIEFK